MLFFLYHDCNFTIKCHSKLNHLFREKMSFCRIVIVGCKQTHNTTCLINKQITIMRGKKYYYESVLLMNTIRDKLFDLNKTKESFAELNSAEQFTITNTNAEKQTSSNAWAKQHNKLLTNGLLFISRANRIYHSAEQHMSSSVNWFVQTQRVHVKQWLLMVFT